MKWTVAERAWPVAPWLVDEPRGWDESGVVGSVRYQRRNWRPSTIPGSRC